MGGGHSFRVIENGQWVIGNGQLIMDNSADAMGEEQRVWESAFGSKAKFFPNGGRKAILENRYFGNPWIGGPGKRRF
jgi:hypothetical protein